jgi:plastocyanin
MALLAVASSSFMTVGLAATFVVQSPGFSFRPTNLTINVNDSVLWTNSHSGVTHDTTHGTASTPAGSRLWASPLLDASLGQTFTFTFSNAGYYPYICKRHVVDNPVALQQTGSVTVTTANLAPTINFTSPVNNTRVTNVAGVTLSVSAADTNGAVADVKFYDNGVLLGVDTTPPYSFFASNLAPGLHPFTAVVTDNLGLTATSSVVNVTNFTFAVTNLVRVTNFLFSPPVVTVAAGSLVIFTNSTSGINAVTHTATGVGGSLEPLCGVATLASGAICTNRFMTPGVYPYFCNIHPSMTGTVVVVRHTNTPSVNLLSPSPDSTFVTNGAIVFTAAASGLNPISSVQYFSVSNTARGTGSGPLFAVTNRTFGAGLYNVFAKATDSLGFGALSATANIRVVAPAPLSLVNTRLTNNAGTPAIAFELTTTPTLTYVVEQSATLPPVWTPFFTNTATDAFLPVQQDLPPGSTSSVFRAFIKP